MRPIVAPFQVLKGKHNAASDRQTPWNCTETRKVADTRSPRLRELLLDG